MFTNYYLNNISEGPLADLTHSGILLATVSCTTETSRSAGHM